MNHVLRLQKADRKNLVAVKRLVNRKGKPFMQTFYVKPDQVPKAPEKPKMITGPDTKMLPAPKPQWAGPLGDERVYMRMGNDAIRIPEDAIDSRIVREGVSYVVHRPYSLNSDKFMQGWQVTEASTGLKVAQAPPGVNENDPEAAKKDLDNFIERHGPEKIRTRVRAANKIADIPTENFDDRYKPTIQPSEPSTDDDIKQLAEHIFTNVLDRGTPEEGDLDEIIEWINNSGDFRTRDEVDNALTTMDFDEMNQVDFAIRFSVDLDDAEAVWDDLSTILDYTSEDIDTVMDWYEKHYDGAQFDISFSSLGTYSDYENDWSDAMVMEYALENDVSIESAQSIAEEMTEEADEEDRQEFELHDVYDSQGNLWTVEELETMVRWMGGDVSGPREHGREADRELREGGTPSVYNTIADLFMTKCVEVPDKVLYRGSPNPVWAEIQVGQKYECGFASFSKNKEFAGAFHRAKPNDQGYDRFIIVCEAPEGAALYGIDLNDIGYNLEEDGVHNNTFEGYANEEEVTLRAPSLEVIRTKDETEGVLKTRYIYVRPADMELVEMLKSQFDSLSERVWQSFNEPLGEPRRPWRKDESNTVPATEG